MWLLVDDEVPRHDAARFAHGRPQMLPPFPATEEPLANDSTESSGEALS
jgi:hypothetical protein